MTRSRMAVVAVCGLVLIALASPAAAQRAPAARDTVTLDHVEDLVEAGRAEDARTALLEWWSGARAKASQRDVQRGFWLRARLTVDPGQAALDYRRLAVEYPGGPYSAQALFRLAQSAWEAGDSVETARTMTRLKREYPGSRVTSAAEAWLAGAGPMPAPPPAAAKDSAKVSPAPTATRDSTPARAPADTGAARPVSHPTPAGADSAAPSAGRYSVQLGAFSTESRARTVQRSARDKGFEARLVHLPGSRLIHVRVGRFDSASAASELLTRLKALGFTGAVVTDANREERSGR